MKNTSVVFLFLTLVTSLEAEKICAPAWKKIKIYSRILTCEWRSANLICKNDNKVVLKHEYRSAHDYIKETRTWVSTIQTSYENYVEQYVQRSVYTYTKSGRLYKIERNSNKRNYYIVIYNKWDASGRPISGIGSSQNCIHQNFEIKYDETMNSIFTRISGGKSLTAAPECNRTIETTVHMTAHHLVRGWSWKFDDGKSLRANVEIIEKMNICSQKI